MNHTDDVTSEKHSVGLYLYGSEINHELVSNKLGLTSTFMSRAGDVIVSSRGETSVRKIGVWAKVLRASGGCVSDAVSDLFSLLPDPFPALSMEEGVESGCIDLFVATTTAFVPGDTIPDMSVEINPELIRRIAQTNLKFSISFAISTE